MMDALPPAFWLGLTAVIITSLIAAWWGKGRIDKQKERIEGLEEQLKNERVLHKVQLSTTETLLEDSRRMNPARLREDAVALSEMQEEEIDRRGARIEELEEQAADNLKTKAERDSGLEEIALLKREKALLEAELELTRKFTAGVTFVLRGNQPPPTGTLSARYIPAAPEDTSHLHNYPDVPGEEGESG